MCKLSFCRFACTEASAGSFPPTIRPAVERGADRHSAGPPVGHVCCEAQRYEGGRYRCSQGTVTSVDHCSLALFLPHLHKNTKSLFVFRLVRKLTTLLCFTVIQKCLSLVLILKLWKLLPYCINKAVHAFQQAQVVC